MESVENDLGACKFPAARVIPFSNLKGYIYIYIYIYIYKYIYHIMIYSPIWIIFFPATFILSDFIHIYFHTVFSEKTNSKYILT